MIDEIVLYSKIEAESLKIHKTSFSLTNIIAKVKKHFEQINNREINLTIKTQPDKVYYIYSDYDKLLTILQTLLLDAYNRTKDGEIELSFSIIEKSNVIFKIKDNGEYLKKSYIANVLSGKWLEANKNIHSDEFGISLMNKLCSYFGQGLKITNNDIRGNTISFDVTTPVECKHLTPDTDTLSKAKSIHGIKALVVEDIKINYTIIKRILEKKGVIVERATDGLEAVSKVSELEYDIVLMDIRMPNMDGIEATKEIRSRGIQIPIIAQTANILAEDKYICIEAGCDNYIGKPINANELIEVIRQYVSDN